MRRLLGRLYGHLRDAIVPQLRSSQHYYEQQLDQYVGPETDWLDLGCGHQVLPQWRAQAERMIVDRTRSVTGIDCDLASIRRHRTIRRVILGDIGALPFPDESFDLVTANMVLEHLTNPERQFAEIGRVLRPGGRLLVHTPNSLGYPAVLNRLMPSAVSHIAIRMLDTRSDVDVFPAFYRVNTERQLASVGLKAGLVPDSVQMVATDAMFAVVPPIALIELLAIRVLLTSPMRRYRSNMIAVLQKPGQCTADPHGPVRRQPAAASRTGSVASDIVIYAADIPRLALHGSWRHSTDQSAAGGVKLETAAVGTSWLQTALASPTDFVDMTIDVISGLPYALWIRLRAFNNSKHSDSVWIQFSNAVADGSRVYEIGTTQALLVNLATDSDARSLNGWGWQNGAYWLPQPTKFTFTHSGAQTIRMQVRESGVQVDQIVLSSDRYLRARPGQVSADQTIVARSMPPPIPR